jgi:hypothetical protein
MAKGETQPSKIIGKAKRKITETNEPKKTLMEEVAKALCDQLSIGGDKGGITLMSNAATLVSPYSTIGRG